MSDLENKVFLGGTCNDSTWREKLIQKLKIDYFNPVVKDWTKECQEREEIEKKKSKFLLYVITPKMTGVYSIAEVVDDSNKRPKRTIFCILEKDDDKMFDEGQLKSLNQVKKMVKNNGAIVCTNLDEVADFLNAKRLV